MRYLLMLFSVFSVLVLVAQTAQADTGNREVDAYLTRASQTATARIADAGVVVPTGLRIRARVDSEGRLTALRVVDSSGSADLDQKAATALRNFRVAAPPMVLVGAEVNVAVGPKPLVTAKAP